MGAMTYGVADSNTAGQNKGVFALMFETIADSQIKRTERQLSRYEHVPARARAGEDDEQEPFGGW